MSRAKAVIILRNPAGDQIGRVTGEGKNKKAAVASARKYARALGVQLSDTLQRGKAGALVRKLGRAGGRISAATRKRNPRDYTEELARKWNHLSPDEAAALLRQIGYAHTSEKWAYHTFGKLPDQAKSHVLTALRHWPKFKKDRGLTFSGARPAHRGGNPRPDPETGLHIEWSPINNAYFVMWHGSVLNVVNTKAEAKEIVKDLTRPRSNPETMSVARIERLTDIGKLLDVVNDDNWPAVIRRAAQRRINELSRKWTSETARMQRGGTFGT